MQKDMNGEHRFKSLIGIGKALILPAVIYIVFVILAPKRFGSFSSMYIIIQQSIIPTLIAYGMAFGMAAGLIDLSPGARLIISSIVGGILTVPFGLPGLVIGCIASGIFLGFLTGSAYTLLKIPSLVISIGLVLIFEIVGVRVAGRGSLVTVPNELSILGREPYNLIIWALCFFIFIIFYNYTRLGLHIRALGNNELVARQMGVHAPRVKFLTFIVGGVFIGIASILQISYAGSIGAKINLGSLPLVFQPIMGMMVGIELSAFCTLALGIFIGELSLSMIFTGLLAVGMPATFQDIVLGIFLIIVMSISANRGMLKRLVKISKVKNFSSP